MNNNIILNLNQDIKLKISGEAKKTALTKLGTQLNFNLVLNLKENFHERIYFF